jgi:hypothetical protein
VRRLEIVVDGVRHRATASGMPRLDLFRALHPTLREARDANRDPDSSEDPELRCYRSGFWATVPIEAPGRPGSIELRADVELDDGSTESALLGRIEVREPDEPPSYAGLPREGKGGLIAVCMASFDPNVDLFRAQVESLRAQTDTSWVCLISDDRSSPERFEAIEETVGDDRRFVVARSEKRLGFYRNFERALEMVPAEAELVALCDHDDRWYPDKLETLRGAIGGAQLVYSDQRLVDAEGRVLSDTMWVGRRNNHTNFPSLLIANTVTGAAMLFRRQVLERALPFPDIPGWEFHDHWLAIVAMATGDVSYVDRPLYDYVQHAGAIVGQVAVEPDASGSRRARWRVPRPRALRGFLSGGRAAYFCAYTRLEVQAQVLLARCAAELTPGKRRALRRLIASERSPLGLTWLAARPTRELYGSNETLGSEAQLVKGILWRRMISVRAASHDRPGRSTFDASFPGCGPESFDQKRLRRWRAGLAG